MLTIRKKQIEAFTQARNRDIQGTIVHYIQQQWPSKQTFPDDNSIEKYSENIFNICDKHNISQLPLIFRMVDFFMFNFHGIGCL